MHKPARTQVYPGEGSGLIGVSVLGFVRGLRPLMNSEGLLTESLLSSESLPFREDLLSGEWPPFSD